MIDLRTMTTRRRVSLAFAMVVAVMSLAIVVFGLRGGL